MLEQEQYTECFSKLLGFISSTFPQGNLSEDATDLRAISELIIKSELTEGEDKLLAYLFTKYELPYSKQPLAIVKLALAIIEPEASPFSENRKLSAAVNHIRINSGVNVKIIQGEAPSIKVIANSKRNASKMITRESNNTLFIEQEPTVIMGRNGSSKFRVEGRVGQVITGGVFGGSMNIDMSGNKMIINGNDVFASEYIEITVRQIASIELQGSSEVEYLGFSQKDLSVTIYGSGDVSLSGKVDMLIGRVTGSGDIRAKELIAKVADLSVTGSGDIKAQVTDDVRAVVSGSGDIRVSGNPKRNSKQVTGSGSIKIR